MFFPITFLLALLAYTLPWVAALNSDADPVTIGLAITLSVLVGSILISFPLTSWCNHATDLSILQNYTATVMAHREKLDRMRDFLRDHKFPTPARMGKNRDEPTSVIVHSILTLEREYIQAQENMNDARARVAQRLMGPMSWVRFILKEKKA
jgi:hypothetical protein